MTILYKPVHISKYNLSYIIILVDNKHRGVFDFCKVASSLEMHCEPGGKVALSGILQPQAVRVIAEYEEYFDHIWIESNGDDWVLIAATNTKK